MGESVSVTGMDILVALQASAEISRHGYHLDQVRYSQRLSARLCAGSLQEFLAKGAMITERTTALINLIQDGHLTGWVQPGPLRLEEIAPKVFDAAASEPLCRQGRNPAFDPASFLRHLSKLI